MNITADASQAQPFVYTLFTRNDAPQGTRCPRTWPELCTTLPLLAPTVPSKSELPLIKLATFAGDYRNDANLETIYGVEGDYDGETVQPEQAVQMLQAAGIEALVYTSPSHRPDAPRWRVLAALSAAVQPSARYMLTARLNGALDGILAPESFAPSQAYYFGAVTGGEPVQWWPVAGRPLDLIDGIMPEAPSTSGTSGTRHDLGEPSLAAPSLEWVQFALSRIDPNDLDRRQWVAILAAAKQAAWSHATPEAVEAMLMEWCARYEQDDIAENVKQIRSLRQTEVGWPALMRKAPGVAAQLAFGGQGAAVPVVGEVLPALDCSGEILTPDEQREWFRGCVSVTKLGRILSPDGSLYDTKAFNLAYGGKRFIYNSEGKLTDDPWKAATNGTMHRLPVAHHLRFLPHLPPGEIVVDEMGRKGVNTYRPPALHLLQGDPSMFLDHLARLVPDEGDRNILLDWMAHAIRFPGPRKVPWAPVIQSVEGAGKGAIKRVMDHAIGAEYVHEPNSKELCTSGAKFNGWLRNKLFILADEIKVGDKYDLIEVLKPMISETRIEIQSKGVDQKREDCYAVWMFFTNYKDAVPVSKNGRRYAIFFSALQTEADLTAAGMDDAYFDRLYKWLDGDGAAIVTDYLLEREIVEGGLPYRAPKTTSWAEAVDTSRTGAHVLIAEAIDAEFPGFRGGWVSSAAVGKLLAENGETLKSTALAKVLTGMGLHRIGQRSVVAEGRPVLYHSSPSANMDDYPAAQGW